MLLRPFLFSPSTLPRLSFPDRSLYFLCFVVSVAVAQHVLVGEECAPRPPPLQANGVPPSLSDLTIPIAHLPMLSSPPIAAPSTAFSRFDYNDR